MHYLDCVQGFPNQRVLMYFIILPSIQIHATWIFVPDGYLLISYFRPKLIFDIQLQYYKHVSIL